MFAFTFIRLSLTTNQFDQFTKKQFPSGCINHEYPEKKNKLLNPIHKLTDRLVELKKKAFVVVRGFKLFKNTLLVD